ncbi:MAG: VacJ family lipoprotein [Alphaproteobacteria bacterium]|nr:VacJ family lipoprotein [Alphaproteobacteria bacterium]
MSSLKVGLCVFGLLWAMGCASTRPQTESGTGAEVDDVGDPLEPLNRGIFAFNRTIDGLILKPAAHIYRGVVPELGREGVHNVLSNWTAPVTFLNDVLQGEPDRASATLGRFFLNTGFGLLGLLDVATYVGAEERHDEDFGQTLAVWGSGEGPYLMLPIFGPSNPRDAVGLVADKLSDPLTWVLLDDTASFVRSGASALDTRSRYLDELDSLERTSIDFYAALRSLYRQRRNADIHNGAVPAEDYLLIPEDIE